MRMSSFAGRLSLPLGLGVVILAVAPFFGLLRDRLLELMPRSFALVLSIGFALTLLVAGILGLGRLRSLHRWRIGGFVLAAVLVGLQVHAVARGPADVSAVERFHILEYGLLAALFYWALRPTQSWLALPGALIAAAVVGVLDETVQWLVPTRVGELRDILLNWTATGIGLLAAVCVLPPMTGRPVGHRSRIGVGLLAGTLILSATGFFDLAHLGHRIVDPQHQLIFRSWFTAEALRRKSVERSSRWAVNPPERLDPLSLEDYFLTEGTSHVRARNEALHRGDLRVAGGEERILEHWYAPVLGLRGLGSGRPLSLPPRQLRRLDRAAETNGGGTFRSSVLRGRVYLRPDRAVLWTASCAVSLALVLAVAWRPRAKG